MFHAYKYRGSASTRERGEVFEIIDDDFREIVEYAYDFASGEEVRGGITAVIGAVIDVYEKRSSNVPANIVRCILYVSNMYRHCVLSDFIHWNMVHIPKFAKYKNDVDKYLLLI